MEGRRRQLGDRRGKTRAVYETPLGSMHCGRAEEVLAGDAVAARNGQRIAPIFIPLPLRLTHPFPLANYGKWMQPREPLPRSSLVVRAKVITEWYISIMNPTLPPTAH